MSSPSTQFRVMRMANSKTEMITGKLRMAMSTWLLVARAAIPDTNVSEEAKPVAASNSVIRNITVCTTGLKMIKLNNT